MIAFRQIDKYVLTAVCRLQDTEEHFITSFLFHDQIVKIFFTVMQAVFTCFNVISEGKHLVEFEM